MTSACARCGGRLHYADQAWRHDDSAIDHYPVHGRPAPEGLLATAKAVEEPEPEPEPIPAPEVMARPATEEEIGGPRTGRRQMVRAAERAGWDVEAHYARGPFLNMNGTLNRIADSLVIRMTKGTEMGVGIWIDGDFHAGWWRSPRQALSFKDLKARILTLE